MVNRTGRIHSRNWSPEAGEQPYPLIAVLICAVGTLVVLFLTVVVQSRASAHQQDSLRASQLAEEEDAETLVQQAIDDAQWRVEILESSRAKTAEQLDLKRRELSHLEDEIRRLRDELELVAAEAEEMEQLAGTEAGEKDAVQARLDRLQDELKSAQNALEKARQDRSKDRPSYALIPYDGPNGTRRQPIYVECLDDRVVFQPEGLELKAVDFEEPITDDNPLAAALRAKREYLKDVTGQDESLAYPLLIVRPSGAHSYAAARAAMKSWETEFGYELVENELPLAYPAPDSALSEVMDVAIEEARARRRYLKLIAPARFGRRESPGLLTVSSGGGFVTQEGSAPRRAGRRAGGIGRSDGIGSAGGSADTSGAVAQNGPGGGVMGDGNTRSGRGSSTSGRGSSESGLDGGSTAAGSLGDESLGDESLGGRGRSTGDYGEELASDDAGSRSGRPRGSKGSGNSGSDEMLSDGRRGSGGNAASGDSASGRSGRSGQSGQQDGTGQGSDGDGTSDGAGGEMASRGGGRPEGGRPANANANSTSANLARRSGSSGDRSAQGGRSSRGGSGASGGAGRAQGAGSGVAGGSSGAAGGSGGSAGGAAGGGAGAAGSFGASGMGAAGSPSSRRGGGGDWGLPGSSIGLTGITRPISVTCSADELVLVPEKRSRIQPTVIEVNGLLSEQLDEVVTKVWQRMDTWGTAGENMYWKPVLQVKVAENGESMYRELVRLLQDSGIEVVRK